MIKNIFIFTATLALSVSAKADISANIQPDTIYSFGTSCSSSGQWTSKAMQATQTLISTIKSLASDPSCQSLSTLVQALSAQQMALQVQSSIDTSGNIAGESPMQTQNRLTALSNVATSTDPSLKPFAARAARRWRHLDHPKR